MRSSPSLLAEVKREAASEPEPGSVKQYEANFSMEASSGTHCSRWEVFPKLSIIHAHMLKIPGCEWIMKG